MNGYRGSIRERWLQVRALGRPRRHGLGDRFGAYRGLMTAQEVGGYQAMTAAERQFIIDSGAPADSFDPARQAEARARLATAAARTRAQAAPELDVAQVASLLACSPSTVRRLARSGSLYALRRGVSSASRTGSSQAAHACPDFEPFSRLCLSRCTRCRWRAS